MAKYKLEVTDSCIKCGLCTAQCPDYFEMKEKAEPKKSEFEELGCAKEMEEACPVKAIKIIKLE